MLPLENEMKTPKAFGGTCGVLNQAMIVIVFLYVGMGLFGYLNYGDLIQGSITLNLPQKDMQVLQFICSDNAYTNIWMICFLLRKQFSPKR